LLEADDVIGRQDVREGGEGKVGDARDLAGGLSGGQGRAVEAAAREAEAKLVDARRAGRPCMLGGDAVAAGERAADVGRGESAAAVGKRRSGARIVAKKGVAGENAVTGGEVAVDADVELVLRRRVGADSAIIVRARLEVGRGISVDRGARGGIEGSRGDRVGRERVADVGAVALARRAGIEDRLREGAALLGGGRDGARANDAGVEPRALPVGEEEGPVPADGAAQHDAMLVAAEARFGPGSREHIAGVQRLVAEELENRSMQRVRARFLVHQDDAPVRAPKLRRRAVGLNAKLFNGVDDWVVSDLSGLGLKHADAVVQVLADPWTAAVDARQEAARWEGDAGGERDQRHEVTAVQRERHDLLPFDYEACRAAAVAQERRFGEHYHGLRGVAERKDEVELNAVADAQDHAVAAERRESGFRDRDGVGACG
jgi:hypothetical protein